MTSRHFTLFTLGSGQSGLWFYIIQRDAAIAQIGLSPRHRTVGVQPCGRASGSTRFNLLLRRILYRLDRWLP